MQPGGFTMRPYQTNSEITPTGIRTALLMGLGAAVAMGFVLYALEHYVHLYLVVMFPLLAGAAVGLALARGIYLGKVRHLAVATALGVICGLSLMLAYHTFSYQIGFKDEFRQQFPGIPESQIVPMSDEILQARTGQTGFLGFMSLQAKQGMTLTRSVGSDSSPISFDGPWVFAFYALEMLIATWMVLAFARRQTLEPFDEPTQRWYGKAKWLFNVPVASQKNLLEALNAAKLEEASRFSALPVLPAPRLDVSLRTAEGGNPNDMVLEVKRLQLNNRPNSATLIKRYLISPAELEALLRVPAQTA
jgi:hypothetical protein